MPDDLLAVLVDRVFHCPVVAVKLGGSKNQLRASLLFRKEFETGKEHDQICAESRAVETPFPEPSRPRPNPQRGSRRTRFSGRPGPSAGKALHMNHQVWASKQLIVPMAMALAFAPALKAAESSARLNLDGKAAIERAPAPPASSDPLTGAQEAQGQTSPRPNPLGAGEPTVKAPVVTYQDGQLTISAENASLSEVMKALHEALGADIDLPAGVADQPIWVHLGPGPASRILRDLLDSTEFNYVIQASETDPGGIRSVLLTPRSKSTGTESGQPDKTGIRWMPGHGPGQNAANAPDAENPPSEPGASSEPSQAAAPPANAPSRSLQNTMANFDASALRANPPTDPNEQVQALQSMYQQRRQLQIMQNQKAAGRN